MRWRAVRGAAGTTSLVHGMVAVTWLVVSTGLAFGSGGLLGLIPAAAGMAEWLLFVAVTCAALWLVMDRSERALRRSEAARRALLQRGLDVRDDQRQRVARDIQESALQYLAAAAIRLEQGGARGGDRDDAALCQLRDGMDALRRIVLELEPPDVHAAELSDLVEAYTAHVLEPAGVRVEIDIDVPADLDPATAAAVHRILVEALSNVALHADADQVRVQVATSDGRVEGHVHDDGAGIPPEPPGDARQVGLEAMRESAARLGGTVDVLPGGTGGTDVTFTLPREPRRGRRGQLGGSRTTSNQKSSMARTTRAS